MKNNIVKFYILPVIVLLSMCLFFAIVCGAQSPTSEAYDNIGYDGSLSTEVNGSLGYDESLSAEVNGNISAERTMVIVPLDSSMVDAAKEFVQQLQASNLFTVSAMVFAPPGLEPYLVLAGSPPDLQQAIVLRQRLLPDKAPMPIVVIAASLREITRSISHDMGLNLIPAVSGTGNLTATLNDSRSVTGQLDGKWSDIVSFNEGLNNSKVLVSSEVYTPNGIKAQISNIKSVPIFSTDSQGNVQTQFQNLETSISVVPKVIEYNAAKPEESFIRVDVDVKVSVISGNTLFKGVSAPEYSVKTMTTTRVLSADNQSNVIGTFVTDSDTKSISGMPILGKLPLLKHLFSRENKQQQRNTAVLTLAVRLLPILSDEQRSTPNIDKGQ